MPNIAHITRMKPARNRAPGATCPHCDTIAIARTSLPVTPLLREIYYQCTNVLCGHTFVASLEIIRTVTPSADPRAGVRLPMQARGSHRQIFPPEPPSSASPHAANDDAAQPALKPDTG